MLAVVTYIVVGLVVSFIGARWIFDDDEPVDTFDALLWIFTCTFLWPLILLVALWDSIVLVYKFLGGKNILTSVLSWFIGKKVV